MKQHHAFKVGDLVTHIKTNSKAIVIDVDFAEGIRVYDYESEATWLIHPSEIKKFKEPFKFSQVFDRLSGWDIPIPLDTPKNAKLRITIEEVI